MRALRRSTPHGLKDVPHPEQENRQSAAHLRLAHSGMEVPDFIDDGFGIIQTQLGLLVVSQVNARPKPYKAVVGPILAQ